MARSRKKKRRTIPAAALCLVLALVTCVMGAVALLYNSDGAFTLPVIAGTGPSAARPGLSGASQPVSEPPSGQAAEPQGGEEPPPQQIPKTEPPSELRAVTIKPGRDFPAEGSADALKAGIDRALEEAKNLTMNGIVIDTLSEDGSVS